MTKLKVMTVVGTRPEIIRLACVIQKLEESEAIEHIIVHTGQNYDYELNEVFFKDFNILVLEKIKRKIANLFADNKNIESVRDLYDLWVITSEEVYNEYVNTAEYSQLQLSDS